MLAVVFFNVSGGPYGVEDAVSVFGPGLTLLLLALTPLLVALPVALAMAEMGGALPEEGGYVTWVRRAFGAFWGFQVGWWSWLNSFVDVAVYPALFADYLRFWRPEMSVVERWIVALGFVWLLTALNLSGVRIPGWGAVALAVGALAPIVALTATAAARAHLVPWSPFTAPGQGLWSGLGLGIAVMMWNYSGWDMPSTVLGETSRPETSYRRALWWALPLIALANIVPVAATLSVTGDWQRWQTGHWPVVAAAVGGPWLAHAVVAGAVTASAGLFLSLVLTNSRLPYVLAREGELPHWLAATQARTGVPWAAVLVSSAGYSLFALASFKELIILNVWLYSLTLLLELAAFVALRLREPALARPWRVGGGSTGLWLTAALPSGAAVLAMATAGWKNTTVGIAVALTGPAVWWW
ncbi:MAG TPA: APC family permease, partial [Methylomirabilota bacterium]